jgi:uncharacterized protein (DUF1501 family)
VLTVNTSALGSRDCEGTSRRDFLRVGSLGLGSLTLSGLLANQTLAVRSKTDYVKDKAVVMLYMSGGASHIETFNPNMDAPSPYNSMTGEVSSSLSGVTFGGTFPSLAKWAHKMAIVRSFSHPIGGHEQAHVHVLSGGTDPKGQATEGRSIGSLCSRIRGANHPKTGFPTYGLLTHPEKDGQYRKELGRIVKGSWPGDLGPSYAPFIRQDNGSENDKTSKSSALGSGAVAADMQMNLSRERLENRKALLSSIDGLRREADASGALAAADEYEQRALDLILGSASKTFDLSEEDPKLLESYDTSAMKIGHKTFRKSTLGHQMLLARRMVESGAGFVTVHSAGWDMHADGNNPGMVKGMNMLGWTLDKAVSAFLQDLEDRGLSDKVLLVLTGDFGRTPTINKRGGRDHWAKLGTLAFAGGGLPMGQVIGKADRRNGEPADNPISPNMMMGTILHTLFDFGKLRIAQGIPTKIIKRVEDAHPIPELVI